MVVEVGNFSRGAPWRSAEKVNFPVRLLPHVSLFLRVNRC